MVVYGQKGGSATRPTSGCRVGRVANPPPHAKTDRCTYRNYRSANTLSPGDRYELVNCAAWWYMGRKAGRRPALREVSQVNWLSYRQSYRRHLPHIQPPGAVLFVTFRLAGSLPPAVQRRLHAEAEWVEKQIARISDRQEKVARALQEHKRMFAQWDAALDSNRQRPQWLEQAPVAAMVAESLRYRDQNVYDLDTFCVMGNHVHVVFAPRTKDGGGYYSLPAIMHSLKLYTATQANKLLHRSGAFWQQEYYDHVVRDEAEWQRIRQYVINNPVKAGLVSEWDAWPWTYGKWLP